MPQDSMRSAVYRSLVTCSDLNGVVEYKTMRKSKSSSRKGQKNAEEHGAPRGSNRYSEGIKEDSNLPLPSQILEVSRGAQKLNLMIDSWSERLSFDGQSTDITRDLLKGALDLQQSLVVLCKLQEPSNYLGQMNQKHNKKYRGRGDGVGVERNDSDGLAEKSKRKEIESGRPSLDGSSKNSVEELKKVIRDSLTRQNLLPNSIIEENDFSFGPRKSGNFSDIPSTSSSQSSVGNSNNSASMDWSASSTEVKARNPSLIAKLMGLEGIPTEISLSHLKQQESKNCLDHQTLVNETEMLNARKAYSSSHDRVPERKTLKEVIDTMRLEGLLESNNVERLAQNPRTSCDSCSIQDDHELPPIVVVKPLRFPCKVNEDSLLRDRRQQSLYDFPKLEPREESSTRRSHQVEGALRVMEMHNKLEAKQELRNGTLLRRKEALSIRKTSEKLQKTIETSIRRNTREQVASNSKEIGENNKRTEKVKKVTPNRNAPGEMKNTKPVTMLRSADHVRPNSTKACKHDNGPTITKNLIHRRETLTHNPILVRSIQSKSTGSSGQVKNISTRKAKTLIELARTSSLTKKLRPKHDNKESSHTNTKASVATMTTSEPEDQVCKMASVPKTTSSDLDDQLSALEPKEPSVQIEDLGEEQKNCVCEIPMEKCQHGNSLESAEELEHLVDHNIKIEEMVDSEINQRELLLCSPLSLLSYVCEDPMEKCQHGSSIESTEEFKRLIDRDIKIEEPVQSEIIQQELILSSPSSPPEDHFELHTNQQTADKPAVTLEAEDMTNTRLFLDCANELMECRSSRILLAGYPLFWIPDVNVVTRLYPEQLLGEVCDSIEKLKKRIKIDDDSPAKDGIDKMLERDIMCKRPLAGYLWDLGWEYGSSVNEVDQVLAEVQEQVLNELIEEITVDYR